MSLQEGLMCLDTKRVNRLVIVGVCLLVHFLGLHYISKLEPAFRFISLWKVSLIISEVFTCKNVVFSREKRE